MPRPGPGWQPGILALGDRSMLQALVDQANFTSATIEAVDMTWTFADVDEYWRFLVDVTAIGPTIRSMPGAARDAFRASLAEQFAQYSSPGRIALPSQCWCGLAIR
jgi:hypothetical protein